MVLTGAGHFGVGFFLGAICMVLVLFVYRRRLYIQLYAPFLPFAFGFLAIVPYMLLPVNACNLPVIFNVFVFYSWLHCQSAIAGWLGNLHLVAVMCAGIYCLMTWRYIRLIKRIRRYGWPS